ncbi:APH(3') family aminoglycoside O-phosphotransferase [Devosia sp. 1566]|uniref:APH(3') family aminoglycoside O-phosphotransferase n=1 Tax=Devosia sp. 1566 TaxID=2499144 RepID=UPI000FDAFAD8|nr:APH(3') family aminoglycoside O-phosphotransferase [Devosia sp. 1566]
MTIPADLPPKFADLAARDWTPITIGKSGARVWRIALSDGTAVFLKSESNHPLAELPGEIDRLGWLTRMGFKAPRIIDTDETQGGLWLLMTAVPGQDLTHWMVDKAEFVRIYAQCLRRLHALDPRTCPFDHSLDQRLAAAQARVAAGLVDETDFGPDQKGWSAGAVLDWLHRNRPTSRDSIVTHGDACAPNILASEGRFSGMVDCARLGVADLWQDLALACRSIQYNIGEEHVAQFLASYGAEWDEVRYRYYNALDNLF